LTHTQRFTWTKQLQNNQSDSISYDLNKQLEKEHDASKKSDQREVALALKIKPERILKTGPIKPPDLPINQSRFGLNGVVETLPLAFFSRSFRN
jgi:hypothetical protein